MENKAFTLIELLAVIVILAIILLIVVPQVLTIIEDAKIKTAEESANLVLSGLKQNLILNELNSNGENLLVIYDDKNKTIYPSSKNLTIDFDLQNAALALFDNGKITLAIYDGEYCSFKPYDSKDIIVESITKETCMSYIYYLQSSAPFSNIVINGDFSNDSTNWEIANSYVENGRMHTFSPAGTDAYFLQRTVNMAAQKIYFNFDLEVVSGIMNVDNNSTYPFSTTGNHSVIYTEVNNYMIFDDNTSYLTDYYVDNIKGVNLTLDYGIGNEPTKEEMDINIHKVWIDSDDLTPYRFTGDNWGEL